MWRHEHEAVQLGNTSSRPKAGVLGLSHLVGAMSDNYRQLLIDAMNSTAIKDCHCKHCNAVRDRFAALESLCVDEGCPHHGTEHVCTTVETQPLQEWRPIETAPKDGTDILVWWPYWANRAISAYFEYGLWHSGDAASEMGEGPLCWMPLPQPPASTVKASDDYGCTGCRSTPCICATLTNNCLKCRALGFASCRCSGQNGKS